eukprot:maker-scaffold1012_size70876-snap-gene-0.11 protein:Tk04103 transcript:maker-scaffold1012_size70876-snap-gene-0.11-mRNA-1 annotation:"exported protein"
MGASDISWGGIPLMLPSTLAMRYLHYEHDIIPERTIEPGARYRTRKCMDENVRGYRALKASLQRKISEIEAERNRAHTRPLESLSAKAVSMTNFTMNDYPRPSNRPYDHTEICFRPYYDAVRPMYKRRIFLQNTEPRAEEFMGYFDVRRKFITNPSEKLRQEL